MRVMKTVLITGISIGAGLVIANYLTKGAVFEAASDVISNAKDRIMTKTQGAAEVVADTAEAVSDVVGEM